jgi:glutamate-1-semialdehyde 2,1-aminomutase
MVPAGYGRGSLVEEHLTVGSASDLRSARQEAYLRRAAAVIPGMTTNNIVLPPEERFLADRAQGPWLFDMDGRAYLDWQLLSGAVVFGHAYEPLAQHIGSVIGRGAHHKILHWRAVELAERICDMVPCAEMVRFAASGSEATLASIRLARAFTNRRLVIRFEGAYHGHLDPLTVSMGLHDDDHPMPMPIPDSAGMSPAAVNEFRVLRYNDIEMVRAFMGEHGSSVAAIIVEPYHRMLSPVPGFLETLRETCDRFDAVLIYDEMVSGFRLAPGGAQEVTGVVPDIAAVGKALTGGHPQLAAVVGRRAIMELFDPARGPERVFHAGTWNANTLAVEAAHFSLDEMERLDGYRRLGEIGEMTRERLDKLFAEYSVPCTMSGWGPLFHPYFTDHPVVTSSDLRWEDSARSAAWHRALYRHGVHKGGTKGYLSLAHDEAVLELAIEACGAALAEVS